jgi:hypothetical protein
LIRALVIVPSRAAGIVLVVVGAVCFGAAVAAAPTKKPSAPKPAAARAAAVTTRPSFSGTWKLDTTRTSFGKSPGRPRSRIDVIEHQDPRLAQTLHLVLESSKDTTLYRYVTDSTESVNFVDRQEIKARVWWEGAELRLDSRTRFVVFDATLNDRWSLSADGKTLTMRRRIKSPLGEDEQTLVFEKQ